MRLRPRTARLRAASPVLEGLETRAMLSHVATPMAESPRRRLTPLRLDHRSAPQSALTTATTVPANGDVNPYGVAFVPSGFPTGGLLNPGDVLVSNFNNSKNLQGTGTTIVRVTPQGQTSVFYQGPPGVGLSTALGVLQAGYVVVGAVPSTDGTSATVGMGSLLILDKNGNVVANMSDPDDARRAVGPDHQRHGEPGPDLRLGRAQRDREPIQRVTTGRRYAPGRRRRRRSPRATSTAAIPPPSSSARPGSPTTPTTGTLYVASTANNKIYAVKNAGTAATQSGKGKVVYKDNTHLHGPLGLTFAADGNLIAAQGDAINANTKRASELVEFTPKGKFVSQFSLSKMEGGAFGVAASADGTQFAAVNDITNSLEVWKVQPVR